MLIVRDVIRRIQPYEWEPSTERLAEKLGLKPAQILRFDTNTSPFTPVKLLSRLGSVLCSIGVNDYPETSYSELRQALSKYLDRNPDQITVTTGGDEALDIIAKTFIEPGTKAILSSPTYSMFRVVVEVMGGRVVHVYRKPDFSDDLDGIVDSSDAATRLIFTCSPNNPTGNITTRDAVVRLLEAVPCAVVVDESYVEFCGKTVVDLVDTYEKLIILRTFSKAFSLAGARVGYIVANEKTVRLLNITRPPNSLSVISLALAKIALENIGYVRKTVKTLVKERERLVASLRKINGLHVYPSEANFILVRFRDKDASNVYRELLKFGIVSRNVSGQPKLENCLRFVVRTAKENSILLKALERTMA